MKWFSMRSVWYVLTAAVVSLGGAATPLHASQPGGGWVEPLAGNWHTWILASGSQFRPSPPPGAAETQVELEELRGLAGQRDDAALDRIGFWDTGAPSYRWNELAVSEALKHNFPSNYGTRN